MNLEKILNQHKLWLEGKGGTRANLRYANLSDTDLSGADLRCASSFRANLSGANLSRADLSDADLSGAILSDADLSGAILSDANLWRANLSYANLWRANLWRADLSDADLRGADLSGAILWRTNLSGTDLSEVSTCIDTIGIKNLCPQEGSFIGYKKANGCLVKLKITEDAKRSNATTSKCRCSKAKVLNITDLDRNIEIPIISSDWDSNFVYEVGKIVEVDDFDNDRWNECSTGIHFFIDKNDAIKY